MTAMYVRRVEMPSVGAYRARTIAISLTIIDISPVEVGANKLFPFLSLDRYSSVQSYWKGLQVSLELQID